MGFFRHLRVCKRSSAQALVEYALLLALVALGVVAAQTIFACQLSCAFENVQYEFERIIANKHIPPGQLKKCSKTCT
jgi:Flp pilus assembly pilin Flp